MGKKAGQPSSALASPRRARTATPGSYATITRVWAAGDVLSAAPALTASTITRTSTSSLAFTATANGATVSLGPFHDAQGFC
ncbi:hypothetical protein ACQP2X_35480 [Actinoplanes sp. CA-131856]